MNWNQLLSGALILATASSGFIAIYLLIDARQRKWKLSHTDFAGLWGTILATIFGALQLVASHKVDVQNEMASHRKDQEINLLKSNVSDARTALTDFQKTLATEQNTIRSLDAVINIHFFANLNESDLPFSNEYIIAAPEQTEFLDLIWWTPPKEPSDIRFYGTKMYRFTKQGPGYYMFVAETSIRSGDGALGRPFEFLKDIRGAVAYMPFTNAPKLSEKSVRVESVQILFTLNNTKRIQRTYNFTEKVPVPTTPQSTGFANVNINIQGSDFFQVERGREWVNEPVIVPAPRSR